MSMRCLSVLIIINALVACSNASYEEVDITRNGVYACGNESGLEPCSTEAEQSMNLQTDKELEQEAKQKEREIEQQEAEIKVAK